MEIIFFFDAHARRDGALVLQRHGRRVLRGDPGRAEHGDLVVRLPPLELAADRLANLAGDVVLARR
jgi:hypothetical protein